MCQSIFLSLKSIVGCRFGSKGEGRVRNQLRELRRQHLKNGIARRARLEKHYALMQQQTKEAAERRGKKLEEAQAAQEEGQVSEVKTEPKREITE